MGMRGACGKLSSIFVLVAGLSLLSNGLGWLDIGTANIVAGVLIALFGVMKLYHSMGMCDSCNAMKAAAISSKRRK